MSKLTFLIIICISLTILFLIIGINSNIFFNSSFNDEYIPISLPDSLFIIEIPKNTPGEIDSTRERFMNMKFSLDPNLSSIYDEIGLDKNAVVIYPSFTETAYSENGFYDFFEKKCDEQCLTVKIKDQMYGEFKVGKAGFNTLKTLGYSVITDIDVDKNPSILQNYEKIILLHNEYVTKSMFNAITNHSKVIYLYPNALYAEILVDYDTKTISLIRGHGYPQNEISNGFDWKFDNTHPFEYNTECIDWTFFEISNGIMLDCYPEYIMYKDAKLLKQIAEY